MVFYGFVGNTVFTEHDEIPELHHRTLRASYRVVAYCGMTRVLNRIGLWIVMRGWQMDMLACFSVAVY